MNNLTIFSVIVLSLFFLIGLQSLREKKRQRAVAENRIIEEYGVPPMKDRGRDEAAVTESFFHAEKEFFLDEITWNDLDMELVFRRINYARCLAGATELYRMLRCPVMEEAVLKERDMLADCMAENSTLRTKLSFALHEIGFTGKYAPKDYLDHLENLGQRSNAKHILMDLLYIPAVAFLFWNPAVGVALLFFVLICNIMTYFKEKGEVNPYLVSFAYILRMIRGAEKVGGILEKITRNGNFKATDSEAEEILKKYRISLEKNSRDLAGFRRFSQVAMSMANPVGGSGPLDILFDYLKMALHLDLMKFNRMLKIACEKRETIKALTMTVGTLDACICIAYFRASLESWCKPGFERDGGIAAKELYHPLLENPMKNSITAENGVLITGSNASGKSTFLKTVALGGVLAQTVCTVPAKSWSSRFYRVMTSMALRDNLIAGESYFMVEIKALKRILDARENKIPILCVVDEVLRGTNTVERIAASGRILRSLAGKEILCFAATHDIELTYLLEDCYANYHFEETIENGDISFNYLLKTGRAQSRNAIKLLQVMGYDKAVVKEAQELAERFLETGKWEGGMAWK